jgi:hypothetical protein
LDFDNLDLTVKGIFFGSVKASKMIDRRCKVLERN